jgi:hypothetical protein
MAVTSPVSTGWFHEVGTKDWLKQIHQRGVIVQIALLQGDLVLDVGNALKSYGAGTAHHADNFVIVFKQQLGQVRAILAGNAGDQRNGHCTLLRCKFFRKVILT